MNAWTAKNPLGIVALFISLIYGMSAMLLGATVSSLSPSNQTMLVWFVVLFPVAVLGAFLWLVAKHHRKLYSPSDFRSDEGFLAEPGTPQNLGSRFVEEADAIATEAAANEETSELAGEGQINQPDNLEGSPPAAERRRAAVATAYLAESLVFKELQSEFGGGVQQHVRIRGPSGRFIELDGLIESSEGSYVVEAKLVRNQVDFGKRLRDAISSLEAIYFDQHGSSIGSKGLVALVLTGDLDEVAVKRRALIVVQAAKMPMTVRVYRLELLLEKYGFEG